MGGDGNGRRSEGKRMAGTPKGWLTPHVPNPEKIPLAVAHVERRLQDSGVGSDKNLRGDERTNLITSP